VQESIVDDIILY